MASIARLLAFGDVHGVQHLGILRASLRTVPPDDIHAILLAGDIIDRGDVSGMELVLREVTSRFKDVPVVSVFGNDEYHEVEDYLIKNFNYVVWLNDSVTVLKAGSIPIGIVGSRGSLDKLTYWQSKNMPQLESVYRRRVGVLRKLIEEVNRVADVTVLLTHYAPTYQTIRGEPEKIYPYMGCRHLEEVIRETKPDLAIHAHAHNATVTETTIGLTRVYNVSLPARKSVTYLTVAPRARLLRASGDSKR
ncbi:MAG: metallophosphoesterase [Sulfolobales archaeon]|nr:metallophosphoesterase [Sulfolobales archaeon]MCX8208323.1 metallophosphoesterase [Sulfolobales archaeon]MDW8010243.1 metallophosphoesterase [Sulfolobales archaeon]